MPKNITVADLKNTFEAFAGLPEEQLQFLIDRGEVVEYPQDSYLFQADLPANNMTFVLEGHFKVFIQQKGNNNFLAEINKGDITGILPYSRMESARANAIASEAGMALQFPRESMRELVAKFYELTEVLVHEMTGRIRTFTSIQAQNERMISLGKLSAGLAHELNNPTAAIARSAKVLNQKGSEALSMVAKIVALDDPMQYLEVADELLKNLKGKQKVHLGMLARQDKEDDWQDYFEDQDLPNCGELIEHLVSFDLDTDFLDDALGQVPQQAQEALIKFLEFELSRQELHGDIGAAAERISELVGSIKSFTHMDQAQDKTPAYLADGLDSTLKILEHKTRKQNIEIVRDYDTEMPRVPIRVGQVNQVFTNILDNAIDALQEVENPKIEIRSFVERGNAYVKIQDNGPGIPEDLAALIFDPFFTTKGVGEGTGMGLEISRRIIEQHNGKLSLDSTANPTSFSICIPITS